MGCYFLVSLTVVDVVFVFKQKTAYEMRISDLSSDVFSSDLEREPDLVPADVDVGVVVVPIRESCDLIDEADSAFEVVELEDLVDLLALALPIPQQIGNASSRESVCQYV